MNSSPDIPLQPPVNYGWTIVGRCAPEEAGLFLSGLEWQAGRLCRIIPRRGPQRPGDFVPVWATAAEAQAVLDTLSRPASEAHVTHWEIIDDRLSITSGGPLARNRLHRGVAGFTIPEKPRDPVLDLAGRSIYHPPPQGIP